MANAIDDYVRIKDPSDIGYHVGKILEDDADIATYFGKIKDPRKKDLLAKKLETIVSEKYEENKTMFNAAEWIDTANRWLAAPVDVAGRMLGGMGIPGGYVASFLARAASWFVKLPYALYYTAKTWDPSVLLWGAGQEAISQFAPAFGGAAYLPSVYTWKTQEYLRGQAANDFKEYIKSVEQGGVIDLEIERRKKQEPPMGDLEEKVEPRRRKAA